MQYPAKIQLEDELWMVEFPDFPSVLTFGESFEDAQAMATQALNGALESDFESGFSLPEPSAIPQGEEGWVWVMVEAHIYVPYLLREERGKVPLQEVAKQLKVAPQTLFRYEQPTGNLTLKTLEKVARVYGKRLDVRFI